MPPSSCSETAATCFGVDLVLVDAAACLAFGGERVLALHLGGLDGGGESCVAADRVLTDVAHAREGVPCLVRLPSRLVAQRSHVVAPVVRAEQAEELGFQLVDRGDVLGLRLEHLLGA